MAVKLIFLVFTIILFIEQYDCNPKPVFEFTPVKVTHSGASKPITDQGTSWFNELKGEASKSLFGCPDYSNGRRASCWWGKKGKKFIQPTILKKNLTRIKKFLLHSICWKLQISETSRALQIGIPNSSIGEDTATAVTIDHLFWPTNEFIPKRFGIIKMLLFHLTDTSSNKNEFNQREKGTKKCLCFEKLHPISPLSFAHPAADAAVIWEIDSSRFIGTGKVN